MSQAGNPPRQQNVEGSRPLSFAWIDHSPPLKAGKSAELKISH
ncbi:Predicted GTPase [Pseudomonas syringae pv. actinidiae]|uniref:Predicted GTPase n=1 Tax=Pseudomonas syringae pv. actinidiae TaxID=103796 RepID=A0A2V0Q7I9_PSESF|nr:Predicted GTPase [Pseudomonas syringae pv. actinidiae]